MTSRKLLTMALGAAVVLTPTVFLSCSSSGGGADATVNVTGTWSGAFSTSLVGGTLVLVLSQTGNDVTGNYTTDDSWGTVSGTVSENVMSFTLDELTIGCPGSFSGDATVTGNSMSVTFTGDDCWGHHDNGRATATKW